MGEVVELFPGSGHLQWNRDLERQRHELEMFFQGELERQEHEIRMLKYETSVMNAARQEYESQRERNRLNIMEQVPKVIAAAAVGAVLAYLIPMGTSATSSARRRAARRSPATPSDQRPRAIPQRPGRSSALG